MERPRKLDLEPPWLLHSWEPASAESILGQAHASPVTTLATAANCEQALRSVKSCAIKELAAFVAAEPVAALRELPLHQEGAARHASPASLL